MKWRVSCREATELVSRAMDERLGLADRFATRVHLIICANCARFARQLQEMRRLLHAETAVAADASRLSAEARERIATELQKALDS